jgi:hypothetical protein
MSEIKAGDNGTEYEFLVRDGREAVPLFGATVQIKIKIGNRDPITKVANITDAAGGVCSITLTREDLWTPGTYSLQGIVKFPNDGDKDFASDIVKLIVGARI